MDEGVDAAIREADDGGDVWRAVVVDLDAQGRELIHRLPDEDAAEAVFAEALEGRAKAGRLATSGGA